MYARHRLDVDFRTLLFGLLAPLRPWNRARIERAIKQAFPRPNELLVCLSVRSGFDLLLEALDLPEGSEAVVSAVTHPDMIGLLDRHGIRVVPVDLDVETLAPRIDLVERAIGPDTRMIVVAHLFGTRTPLRKLERLARASGLILVEDCAQSFRGPAADRNSPADVSMFSFGSIKTSTALGGAVLRVRDPRLRARMDRQQAGRPIQSRSEYFGRAARSFLLHTSSLPPIYEFVWRGSQLVGIDLDSVIRSGVRGFGSSVDEPGFLQVLRRRPSSALLAVLARRVLEFDIQRFERRVLLGEQLLKALPQTLEHPGAQAELRTHWLFPVIASDPEDLQAKLAASGFDATQATSAIDVVHAPTSSAELEPLEATRMMEHALFVPLYPELTDEAIDHLATALATSEQQTETAVKVTRNPGRVPA